MKPDERFIELLRKAGITLVLVDVGASGDVWAPFQRLLPVADLIRFDPDLRAITELSGDGGGRRITINKVVSDKDEKDCVFYLTKSPYCSSHLEPDMERIGDYSYSDLFEVEKIAKLPAITLRESLKSANLERIDWLKLDTQGTELRLVQSLPREVMDKLSVVDIESSLYAHYKQADLAGDILRFFRDEEFWIAKMEPHMRTRLSKGPLEKMEGFEKSDFLRRVQRRTMHQAPTTLEMTYARTMRGADKANYCNDDYIRLFACHYAIDAFEYCLEIVAKLKGNEGAGELAEDLEEIIMLRIQERTRSNLRDYIKTALKMRMARLLKK